ncbi:MAG TPA: hypothetical protein EYP34_14625 [Chromatiaceae bacterium]|nr:hypothetical protein [Chromatiaceae bacterium]
MKRIENIWRTIGLSRNPAAVAEIANPITTVRQLFDGIVSSTTAFRRKARPLICYRGGSAWQTKPPGFSCTHFMFQEYGHQTSVFTANNRVDLQSFFHFTFLSVFGAKYACSLKMAQQTNIQRVL